MSTKVSTASLPLSAATATVHRQIERIEAGLSFRAVRNLQKALDIPLEKIAGVLGMSRATLHRRKIQGRIDKEESEKLVRYRRLLEKAEEVFGNPASARDWLTHKQDRSEQRGAAGIRSNRNWRAGSGEFVGPD